MNSKNAVHAQLFFEFKQFSKNDMRFSGQALFKERAEKQVERPASRVDGAEGSEGSGINY